jgi:hypothetical protein
LKGGRSDCNLALFIRILVGTPVALETAMFRHVPECPAKLFQSHLFACGPSPCFDGICGKDRAAGICICWQQAKPDQVIKQPPPSSQASIMPPPRATRHSPTSGVRLLRLWIPTVREDPHP